MKIHLKTANYQLIVWLIPIMTRFPLHLVVYLLVLYVSMYIFHSPFSFFHTPVYLAERKKKKNILHRRCKNNKLFPQLKQLMAGFDHRIIFSVQGLQ